MKITGSSRMDIINIYNDSKSKGTHDKAKTSGKFDTVEISKEGMKIAEYINIAKDISDIRNDKVNEIKNKIAGGTYNVSAKELTLKIMEAINEEKK